MKARFAGRFLFMGEQRAGARTSFSFSTALRGLVFGAPKPPPPAAGPPPPPPPEPLLPNSFLNILPLKTEMSPLSRATSAPSFQDADRDPPSAPDALPTARVLGR